MSDYQTVISIVVHDSDISLLMRAIASVRQQGGKNYVMIINNGSSPDYSALLDDLDGVDHVLHTRNGGFGYGHNQLIHHAPLSDFLLILNPDAQLHTGALPALVAHMDAHAAAGLVVPKALNEDGTLQPLNKRTPNVLDLGLRLLLPASSAIIPWIARRAARYTMTDIGYDHAYQLEFASGCCMLIRRDIFFRLGGFDEKFFLYFEDADMTCRVNEIAQSWYCPNAVITHAWQRASRKHIQYTWIMIQSAARYFAKWGVKLW